MDAFGFALVCVTLSTAAGTAIRAWWLWKKDEERRKK